MKAGRFLSFRLPVDVHPDEMQLALAESMTFAGYEVDLNPRPDDPDWYILVRAASGITFGVVLVVYIDQNPSNGFIVLERASPELALADDIRAAVNPILEKAVSAFPNISMVKWHDDHTTLKELR